MLYSVFGVLYVMPHINLPTFYRGGTERLYYFPKITQLLTGGQEFGSWQFDHLAHIFILDTAPHYITPHASILILKYVKLYILRLAEY